MPKHCDLQVQTRVYYPKIFWEIAAELLVRLCLAQRFRATRVKGVVGSFFLSR